MDYIVIAYMLQHTVTNNTSYPRMADPTKFPVVHKLPSELEAKAQYLVHNIVPPRHDCCIRFIATSTDKLLIARKENSTETGHTVHKKHQTDVNFLVSQFCKS